MPASPSPAKRRLAGSPVRATRPVPAGPTEARLGAQFRAVRRRQRWSLQDLARALGIQINTLRWHEYGARMLRTDSLVRAAEIMGVDAAELINPQDEEVEA